MHTPEELYREYTKNMDIALEVAQALRNSFADEERMREIYMHIHKYDSLRHLYFNNLRRNNASI